VLAYLVVFLAAFVTTFAATPLVRRFVVRAGLIYEPNDRTVHAVPTPTMGGIAMYGGFVVALGVSLLLPAFLEVNQGSSEPLASFVTCSLMVVLGVVDDWRGTTGLTKFTAQVFIGGVLVLMGVQIVYFWVPSYGIVDVAAGLGVPLTIAWVVMVANAVNLIDGLDGLASGIVAIAGTSLFIYLVQSPSPFGDGTTPTISSAAILAAITVGVSLGFLPWNFNPARIFMGDSGSMLLGMLLAIATISGIGRNPYPPTGGDLAAIGGTLAVPLLVLFVPILDVALAVIRRTRRRQGFDHADKEHLHHRLMDIGHSHRQAVLLLYLWGALAAGSALAIALIDGRVAVGIVLVVAAILFALTALPRLLERRQESNGGPPEDPAGAVAQDHRVDAT
jgi:UDP-GlcNAc:undecaprenyl-phosphate GlcNAc-1-phosphate transferase